MYECHGASPEELGEQQPLTGHGPCEQQSPATPRAPTLLQQTSTQTLLRHEYNSWELIPWETILLELPYVSFEISSHPVHLRLIEHMVHAQPRSVSRGTSDFPSAPELTEHIPVQPTFIRSSTSGTRNCINKFTQLNRSTPPGTVLSLYQKSPFPEEKVPFLLKSACLLPLRQALMPTFHTLLIKWNIFPSNHWMVLKYLFLKVTSQGFPPWV